jgi:dTDP-4-amino-4,6-dideoxygalactose transaminase
MALWRNLPEELLDGLFFTRKASGMTRQEIKVAPVMEEGEGRIVLFRPNVPKKAVEYISRVLESRWIGQGPRVDEFEKKFEASFGGGHTAISCGSGTDALHLAYLLAGVKSGDEVICTVFTCTASNLPALYIGATPIFADIVPSTLNIDPAHVRSLITSKTKAIVFVDYGGLPADLDELVKISQEFNIPLIEDAAHALGAKHNDRSIGSISDYTIFSFQAIKHITTGDGGMLMIKDPAKVEEAKRLRWFGIDRNSKFHGIWENDIHEVGFKYQMNDIAAAMGLAALEEFDETLKFRKLLLSTYVNELQGVENLEIVGAPVTDDHAAWLFTVLVPDAKALRDFLFTKDIESGQVHFRNDRYTLFGGRKTVLPNMDNVESRYLVLPLHTHMVESDVIRITRLIREFLGN